MDDGEKWGGYPLTVIRTRYGGVYEGGAYAAFGIEPQQIPDAVLGGDTDCMLWWEAHRQFAGVGDTLEAAVAALELADWPPSFDLRA